MSPIPLNGSQPAWGIPDFSPFVVKLETWMRLAGLPYERRAGNPLKAPKGKIPFVELDGRFMGDSQLIIGELTRRHAVTLDDGMSASESATGHAVRRMLEEGTYFLLARLRWLEEDGWKEQYAAFQKLFPPVVGALAVPMVRRDVRRSVHLQGAGRHSRDEAMALAVADLRAVEAVLGDRPFLLGDAPRGVDATVYAFLVSMQLHPGQTEAHAAARVPALSAYTARIAERYWSPTELAMDASSP
jgi:glutathione S-transferase